MAAILAKSLSLNRKATEVLFGFIFGIVSVRASDLTCIAKRYTQYLK